MHIIRHDAEVLQLRQKGAMILVAVGLLGILLAPIWLPKIAETATLTCKRPPDTLPSCTVTRSLLSFVTKKQEITNLQGAYVERTTDDEGDTHYRVILRTQQGDIPLSNAHSSGYKAKATTAEEINEFISDTTATQLTTKLHNWSGVVLSIILIAANIGVMLLGLSAITTVWTFDHRAQLITKTRWTLTGSKVWQYPIQDIVDVIVAPTPDSEGSTTYRVELITRDDRSIPLTSWYSSGYRGKERTANLIRRFLKLE